MLKALPAFTVKKRVSTWFSFFAANRKSFQTLEMHEQLCLLPVNTSCAWDKAAELGVRARLITWPNASVPWRGCTSNRVSFQQQGWFFEQVCKNICMCICASRMKNKPLSDTSAISWNRVHALGSRERADSSSYTNTIEYGFLKWNFNCVPPDRALRGGLNTDFVVLVKKPAVSCCTTKVMVKQKASTKS